MGTLERACISQTETHWLDAGHANQDSNAVARDQVYIVRNTMACPNKLGMGMAPAPAPSAAGQLVMSASTISDESAGAG